MLKRRVSALLFSLIFMLVQIRITAGAPLYAFFSHVKHISYENYDVVEITFDAKRNIDVFTLKDPERIVIDVKYALYEGKLKSIEGSSIVTAIRYAQNSKNVVRIALDTGIRRDYRVEQEDGLIRVYVGDLRGETRRENSGRSSKVVRTEEPGREGEKFRVVYDNSGSAVSISVLVDDYKGYLLMGLSDPPRMVLDIPGDGAPVDMREITVDSGPVKSVRYARYSQNLSRVVVDLMETSAYKVKEGDGELTLIFENPKLMNLTYDNRFDRVTLLLNGLMLTTGGEKMEKHYTEKYSPDGLTYTLTFKSSLGEMEEGEILLGDEYFESIQVIKSSGGLNTSIVFKGKERLLYNVMARATEKNTAVTILRPPDPARDMVVIDAGHGGSEPGAIHKGILEKDLNLDIALRVNDILRERGIETYMVREEDIYVGLYERSAVANLLDAKLFLSIHNNAMDNKSFDGTMTLYSINKSEGKGFNSLDFSKIVHRNLLEDLKTTDRNVRKRDDLVVLRLTKMPSVLAEVSFMTNAEDLDNLLKEQYRQRAAQSLARSVIEALSEIN